MGETTHQIVGETTQGRRAKRLRVGGRNDSRNGGRNDSGAKRQGETTQGERESGRNDPLPFKLDKTDSVGREKVNNTKRPKTSKDKVALKLSSNMKVSGQVCGMPISWKVDTGAKKTFISLKAYKSIPYRNRPVLS